MKAIFRSKRMPRMRGFFQSELHQLYFDQHLDQAMKSRVFRHPHLEIVLAVASLVCVAATPIWCQRKREAITPLQVQVRSVPDVIGRTCIEASGILEKAGFGYECVDWTGVDDLVTRQNPEKDNPAPLRTKVKVYFDVEVPPLKGDTVSMAGERLRNVGLSMVQAQAAPGDGNPGTVSDQKPEAHTFVRPRTLVTVQVVPDQLLLIPSSNKLQVAEFLTLQASLVPARKDAHYTFDWGDGPSSITETTQPTAQHVYREPGHFVVRAWVTDSDGEMRVDSNTIEMQVEPYTVSLDIEPIRPKPGEQVTLRANLEPPPSGEAEYSFSFSGERGQWRSRPDDTHIYDVTGDYAVSVEVMINKIDVGSSRTILTVTPADGGVTPPDGGGTPPDGSIPWGWFIAGGTAIIVLTTSIRHTVRKRRVQRLRKEVTISVTTDTGNQVLEHPSLVRSEDVVLVRAISPKGIQHPEAARSSKP